MSALLAPCSGRSDAMMNFGEPLPPYWSLPHDEAGRTVGPACLFALPTAAATMASAAMLAAVAPKRIRFFTFPPPIGE
jgi:hypothetical protein